MILLAADQVAGAEYLLPLLQRWRENPSRLWRMCASPRSAKFLERHGICFDLLTGPESVEKLVAETQFNAVLMSSSADSTIEATFRRVLKRQSTPCYQFIDTWANYGRRFTGEGGRLDLPDAILTLDNDAAQAMAADGIPSKVIWVIGQPYFEARYLALHSGAAQPRNAGRGLVVTQPIFKYRGRELGYDEHDFVRCCLEAWKVLGQPWSRIEIVVHPDEDSSAYESLLAGYGRGISVIDNAGLDLRRYSAVMGMYSSLMIQSVLASTPTVSVEPGVRDVAASFLAQKKIIPRFGQVADLAQWLKVTLSDPLADRPNNSSLLYSILGSCDRLETFLLANAS